MGVGQRAHSIKDVLGWMKRIYFSLPSELNRERDSQDWYNSVMPLIRPKVPATGSPAQAAPGTPKGLARLNVCSGPLCSEISRDARAVGPTPQPQELRFLNNYK